MVVAVLNVNDIKVRLLGGNKQVEDHKIHRISEQNGELERSIKKLNQQISSLKGDARKAEQRYRKEKENIHKEHEHEIDKREVAITVLQSEVDKLKTFMEEFKDEKQKEIEEYKRQLEEKSLNDIEQYKKDFESSFMVNEEGADYTRSNIIDRIEFEEQQRNRKLDLEYEEKMAEIRSQKLSAEEWQVVQEKRAMEHREEIKKEFGDVYDRLGVFEKAFFERSMQVDMRFMEVDQKMFKLEVYLNEKLQALNNAIEQGLDSVRKDLSELSISVDRGFLQVKDEYRQLAHKLGSDMLRQDKVISTILSKMGEYSMEVQKLQLSNKEVVATSGFFAKQSQLEYAKAQTLSKEIGGMLHRARVYEGDFANKATRLKLDLDGMLSEIEYGKKEEKLLQSGTRSLLDSLQERQRHFQEVNRLELKNKIEVERRLRSESKNNHYELQLRQQQFESGEREERARTREESMRSQIRDLRNQ